MIRYVNFILFACARLKLILFLQLVLLCSSIGFHRFRFDRYQIRASFTRVLLSSLLVLTLLFTLVFIRVIILGFLPS